MNEAMDTMLWRAMFVFSLLVSVGILLYCAYRSGRKAEARARRDAYTVDGDPTGLPDVGCVYPKIGTKDDPSRWLLR